MTTPRARPPKRRIAIVAFGLLLGLWNHTARADGDDRKACIASHVQGQLLRRNHKLIEARDTFLSCSRAVCPGVIRSDCVEWHEEVARSIPTAVVGARSPRGDEPDAELRIDGAPAPGHFEGTPVELNPGAHAFEFVIAGFPAQKQTIILREGEKDRNVIAVFGDDPNVSASRAAAFAPPVPTRRPVPALVYVSGGAAVVAGVLGGIFGAQANSKKSAALGSCAPFCDSGAVNPIKQNAVLANVSFAVAVAALAAGAVFYFTRPEYPIAADAAAQVARDPFLSGRAFAHQSAPAGDDPVR